MGSPNSENANVQNLDELRSRISEISQNWGNEKIPGLNGRTASKILAHSWSADKFIDMHSSALKSKRIGFGVGTVASILPSIVAFPIGLVGTAAFGIVNLVGVLINRTPKNSYQLLRETLPKMQNDLLGLTDQIRNLVRIQATLPDAAKQIEQTRQLLHEFCSTQLKFQEHQITDDKPVNTGRLSPILDATTLDVVKALDKEIRSAIADPDEYSRSFPIPDPARTRDLGFEISRATDSPEIGPEFGR